MAGETKGTPVFLFLDKAVRRLLRLVTGANPQETCLRAPWLEAVFALPGGGFTMQKRLRIRGKMGKEVCGGCVGRGDETGETEVELPPLLPLVIKIEEFVRVAKEGGC